MSSETDRESPFSLPNLRGEYVSNEHTGEKVPTLPWAAVEALIDVAEAAQAVDDSTLVCPAGHLDALGVALSKFEEAE